MARCLQKSLADPSAWKRVLDGKKPEVFTQLVLRDGRIVEAETGAEYTTARPEKMPSAQAYLEHLAQRTGEQ